MELTTIEGQTLGDITINGTTIFYWNSSLGTNTTAPPYRDALDLKDLDTGTYRVKFELDKKSCNMLDISSPEYSFTVCSKELTIEAVKDVVGRGEDMSVKIKGDPVAYYYVTVTGVDVSAPPEIEYANEVFNEVAVDENKEFEEEWDTSGLVTGSYSIDVYIDRAEALNTEISFTPPLDPSDYEDIDEDVSTVIRLVEPELTAKQLRNVVAEDDDYTIEGTATGVDEVDVVLVGPNGYPSTDPGLGVENGLEIRSTAVTDNEFRGYNDGWTWF